LSSHSTTDRLDLLAIGAHPDDVELFCGGTLALLARMGRRVGLAHLTRGESGTRGSAEIRAKESAEAARALGASSSVTLDLGDGRLADTDHQRKAVVELIRRFRPKVVLTHFEEDRHPDHAAARALVRSAVFFAHVGGYAASGSRHKVGAIAYFHGHEGRGLPPADWIVDVSPVYGLKLEALRAYATQFNAPAVDASPATHISSPEFWSRIEITARRYGSMIGAEFGEAFALQDAPHRAHPFIRIFEND
jgi:N-acetylglucosamine malate deacetylase 1